MISFSIDPQQSERMTRFLSGETGGELIDLITDHFVLNSSSTPEAKAGAGDVLKFLRSLASDENLIVTKRQDSEKS